MGYYLSGAGYPSDIYSLGITIIRLLTGLYPPISSHNHADNLQRIKKDATTGEIIWNDIPSVSAKLKIQPEFQAIINNRYSHGEMRSQKFRLR